MIMMIMLTLMLILKKMVMVVASSVKKVDVNVIFDDKSTNMINAEKKSFILNLELK